MRVCLEKNKKLLINIIIYLGSLTLLLFQLFGLNYIFDEAKANLIMIADEYLFFPKHLIKEDVIFTILINLLFVLVIGTLIYYVYLMVSFIRENHTISMKILIIFKGIYLFMIVCFLLLHSVLIKINSLIGYLFLVFALLCAIYDFVSTIQQSKNIIKKTDINYQKLFYTIKFIILLYPVFIIILLYITVLSVI